MADDQGEEQGREVIRKFKSDVESNLKKLEDHHQNIQKELNAAIRAVEETKAIVNRFYGPSCGKQIS
jgi:hypothetical protein